jgi:hypothetical protein
MRTGREQRANPALLLMDMCGSFRASFFHPSLFCKCLNTIKILGGRSAADGYPAMPIPQKRTCPLALKGATGCGVLCCIRSISRARSTGVVEAGDMGCKHQPGQRMLLYYYYSIMDALSINDQPSLSPSHLLAPSNSTLLLFRME